MAALDKVMELQNRGFQEADIIRTLRDEGVSPQEINDAMNQAKVKTAVTQDLSPPSPSEDLSQDQFNQFSQEMQQSEFTPEGMEQSTMQPPQMQVEEQAPMPQEEQYYYDTPQSSPQDQGYYDQQPFVSTDTITEITEQVVIEKFDEFRKKTGDLVAFKNKVTDDLKDLNERLKRIEGSIENLQQSVIGRIGEFGETAESIHKDLDLLHETTSKLMNPLIDNYRELKKIAEKK